MRRRIALTFGVALVLAACSSSSTSGGDGEDAGGGSSGDAGSSRGRDAGKDGALDGGSSIDGGADAGATDPGSCCVRDTAHDGSCSASKPRAFDCFCPGGISAPCDIFSGTELVCCP